jgi:transposase
MIADKIEALLADKGYDADAIREELTKADVEAVIPAKSNRREPIAHDREKYRWRNLVERLFNKLKNWRRIATRYDKTKDLTSALSISCQSCSGYPLSTKPSAFGEIPTVDLTDVDRARSAAFLITAYEGGQVHLDGLASDALSYDPATRDRLIAGAALSTSVYEEALAYREIFGRAVASLFDQHDVLIAPATYGPAPLISDPFILIDGVMQPARANLGLYSTDQLSWFASCSRPFAGGRSANGRTAHCSAGAGCRIAYLCTRA